MAKKTKSVIAGLRPGNPEVSDAAYPLRPFVTLDHLIYGTENGVAVFVRHFNMDVIAKRHEGRYGCAITDGFQHAYLGNTGLYKAASVVDWHEDNKHLLQGTRCHSTRSGGLHYIFLFPEGFKHPATLRPGVDLKGHGGYTCWIGTPGYILEHDNPIQAFPMELLQGRIITKPNGTTFEGDWNDAT